MLLYLDDAAEEARVNVQQLTARARYMPNDVEILYDPLVFNSAARTSWSLSLAAPFDVNVKSLCRLVTSAIEASLCELSGQGLATYYVSDTADAYIYINVICVAPRDADGVVANWITPDDITPSNWLMPHVTRALSYIYERRCCIPH